MKDSEFIGLNELTGILKKSRTWSNSDFVWVGRGRGGSSYSKQKRQVALRAQQFWKFTFQKVKGIQSNACQRFELKKK